MDESVEWHSLLFHVFYSMDTHTHEQQDSLVHFYCLFFSCCAAGTEWILRLDSPLTYLYNGYSSSSSSSSTIVVVIATAVQLMKLLPAHAAAGAVVVVYRIFM
jgi:hypothetical protein